MGFSGTLVWAPLTAIQCMRNSGISGTRNWPPPPGIPLGVVAWVIEAVVVVEVPVLV